MKDYPLGVKDEPGQTRGMSSPIGVSEIATGGLSHAEPSIALGEITL